MSETQEAPLVPTVPQEDDEAVQAKHPSVPDVRGGGRVGPTEPQYQPPKEHLGLNPANQWNPDATPTAAPDRSVPDAPVVGGQEREPLPDAEGGRQAAARRVGAAWPPLAAEGSEPKGSARK